MIMDGYVYMASDSLLVMVVSVIMGSWAKVYDAVPELLMPSILPDQDQARGSPDTMYK